MTNVSLYELLQQGQKLIDELGCSGGYPGASKELIAAINHWDTQVSLIVKFKG